MALAAQGGQEAEPVAAEPKSLSDRVKDLREKCFMPWAEAEALALSEIGIDEDEINKLIETYAPSSVEACDAGDLRQFVCSILVNRPSGTRPRDRLYSAVNEMMAHLGRDGQIDGRHAAVDAVMTVLHGIDGGSPPMDRGSEVYTHPPRTQGDAPYSLDADPAGIRRLVTDAIIGALAFGAQGTNTPPEGHWLAYFWEMARSHAQGDADKRDAERWKFLSDQNDWHSEQAGPDCDPMGSRRKVTFYSPADYTVDLNEAIDAAIARQGGKDGAA
jgi:hypothetical protein